MNHKKFSIQSLEITEMTNSETKLKILTQFEESHIWNTLREQNTHNETPGPNDSMNDVANWAK